MQLFSNIMAVLLLVQVVLAIIATSLDNTTAKVKLKYLLLILFPMVWVSYTVLSR